MASNGFWSNVFLLALQETIQFQSKKTYLVALHKLFCGCLACISLRGEIRTSRLIENQRVKGNYFSRYKNAETIINATQVTQNHLSR